MGKHHRNNCFRQEAVMDAKTGRQKNNEQQSIYIVLKCFPTRCLLITKEKNKFRVENPRRYDLKLNDQI